MGRRCDVAGRVMGALFEWGRENLGARGGGMVAKAHHTGSRDVIEMVKLMLRVEAADDPRSYLGKVLKGQEEAPADLTAMKRGVPKGAVLISEWGRRAVYRLPDGSRIEVNRW